MTEFDHLLSVCTLEDASLRGFLGQFGRNGDGARSERLRKAILGIVEERERTNFIIRYLLRDYDTWQKVLTDEESRSTEAHPAAFFEPHLIDVIAEKGGSMVPMEAIQSVLDRVKDQLNLADFAVTTSKRFRYDTSLRFLANSLKNRGVLSRSAKHKNKLWVLEARVLERWKSHNPPLSD